MMNSSHLSRVLGALGAIISMNIDAATIELLPDLPGGATRTMGFAVSGDGGTIAGAAWDAEGNQASRWRNGNVEGLGVIAGGTHDTVIYGLSRDGNIAVGMGQQDSTHRVPIIWRQGQPLQVLPVIGESGFNYSVVIDLTPSGETMVGTSSNTGGRFEAFTWTSENGFTILPGAPVSGFNTGTGISADGSVISGGTTGILNGLYPNRAVIWRRNPSGQYILEDLGDLNPPSNQYFTTGISADGLTVTGYARTEYGWRGYCWTAETGMIEINQTENPSTVVIPLAISGNGRVIVGQLLTAPETYEAFIWTARLGLRTIRSLLIDYNVDLSIWSSLVRVQGVSDDGRVISGYGITEVGNVMGFRVSIPEISLPEDINGDGSVDFTDLGMMMSTFGSCAHSPTFIQEADFDSDGCVGLIDFTTFLSHYGQAN